MNRENQEVIYFVDDDESKVFCEICDKLCIERFYENHLISQSHTNNFYKRQRINNTNKIIVFIKVNVCDECFWFDNMTDD